MLDFIRRILWLTPKFFAVAVALFALYAQLLPKDDRRLPLFLNSSPGSASAASARALDLLVHDKPEARAEIERLGAFFVLYAIPRQSTLDLETRARLLEALRPIRERMGLLPSAERASRLRDETSEDTLFWTRFVEERSLDFTAQARARTIKRLLTDRLHLKGDDLRVLDTYALPALVDALGTVKSTADAERVRKLAAAIARLVDPSFALHDQPTPDEARETASRIRAYWDRAGPDFAEHAPLDRVYQSITQTEFLIWASRVGRWIIGMDQSRLAERARLDWAQSGRLYLTSVLSAIVLGPLLALALTVRALGRAERRRSLTRRLALVAILALMLGAVATSRLTPALEVSLAATLAGLTSAFVLDRELRERFDFRMTRVLSRRRPLARAVAVVNNMAPGIPTLLPLVLLEALVIPLCLPGQGQPTGFRHSLVSAFRSGDVEYLMLLSLSLGLATALLQIAADALLNVFRRRLGELR